MCEQPLHMFTVSLSTLPARRRRERGRRMHSATECMHSRYGNHRAYTDPPASSPRCNPSAPNPGGGPVHTPRGPRPRGPPPHARHPSSPHLHPSKQTRGAAAVPQRRLLTCYNGSNSFCTKPNSRPCGRAASGCGSPGCPPSTGSSSCSGIHSPIPDCHLIDLGKPQVHVLLQHLVAQHAGNMMPIEMGRHTARLPLKPEEFHVPVRVRAAPAALPFLHRNVPRLLRQPNSVLAARSLPNGRVVATGQDVSPRIFSQ